MNNTMKKIITLYTFNINLGKKILCCARTHPIFFYYFLFKTVFNIYFI